MSANGQILGNVHGGEATASGSANGGDAAEPTRNSPAEDAADGSSQVGDKVEDGVAGSAPRPADPSVPSANGAVPLIHLPGEIILLITADVDPIAHQSLRLSCHDLRKQLGTSPLMSHEEFIKFNRQLEVHSARRLKSLLCTCCNTFKNPTPSKATFTDAQAVQKHGGRRFCVDCGIANGHYDKRDVVIKRKKHFVCGGCKVILRPEKEERVVADVVMTKGFSYHDDMWGKGAQITITSGGKRWCKPCRVALAGLGGSSAVKVKSVNMP